MKANAIERVERAIQALSNGRMIIVEDDEDRENEGDFVMPVDTVTPEAVNFMAVHGRGLLCAAITSGRALELDLPPMVGENTAAHRTGFTVSVDAKEGATTGISASDRARTLRLLSSPSTLPEDLGRPGHVFPLVAKAGGVLKRRGHTEATVDLARLAGFYPAGALCEIAKPDGSMARHDDLVEIAERHDLILITMEDLVTYRELRDRISVKRYAEARLPTRYGEFEVISYRNPADPLREPIALVNRRWTADRPALVRVHSECLTGESFGSQRCDCADQLEHALARIGGEGGALVYLRQEGRGIGLGNKIRAYALQDRGLDTVEANEELGCGVDLRDYRIAAEILRDLGMREVRLLTNNPAKIEGLEAAGVRVTERVPSVVPLHRESVAYIEAKISKMGHLYETPTYRIKENAHAESY